MVTKFFGENLFEKAPASVSTAQFNRNLRHHPQPAPFFANGFSNYLQPNLQPKLFATPPRKTER